MARSRLEVVSKTELGLYYVAEYAFGRVHYRASVTIFRRKLVVTILSAGLQKFMETQSRILLSILNERQR